MNTTRLNIAAALAVLWSILLFPGCVDPEPSPVAFTGGLQELVPADLSVTSRSAVIWGEHRPAYLLAGGRPFLSAPLTLPADCSLELGYSFLFGLWDEGARSPENRSVTARFRARLHLRGGRTADLIDRTVESSTVRGWHDERFDLAGHAGRTVRLELEITFPRDGSQEGSSDVEPLFSVPVLVGPADRPAGEGRLLLVISLDSLRADALGCAGYQRVTSPHLDRFSRDAVHYSTCLSPSPWTRPAHMSLLTSLYPQVHGLDRAPGDFDLSRSFSTWAEIFGAAGFQTLGITGGGFVHPSHGFERGFRRLAQGRRDLAHDCRRVVQDMRKWRETDLFYFLHSFATHAPYNLHGDLAYHSSEVTIKTRRLFRKKGNYVTPEYIRKLRCCYDDGVFYADHCLGQLFRTLRKEGLYDRAMIVVLSDHGDGFLEHGVLGHSTQVYDNLLKVPLLVKYPAGLPAGSAPPPGAVVRRPVELLDLLPTAVELFGISTPVAEQFTGSSLNRAGGPDRDWVYGETYQQTPGLKTVRFGNLSYIMHRETGREELYDLAADPGQQHNLAANGPDQRLSTARLRLGLARSLGRPGLHLALGQGPLNGRLRAGCPISDVTLFFPESVGTAQLGAHSRELLFSIHSSESIPLDIAFALEDPSAPLSISLDRGDAPLPVPVTILFGVRTAGEGRWVSGGDEALTLAWNSFPGQDQSGGPWVQLYRRGTPRTGERMTAAPRETEMLKELGYLE